MKFLAPFCVALVASAGLVLAAPVAAPLIQEPLRQSVFEAERADAVPPRLGGTYTAAQSSTKVSAFAEDDKKADPPAPPVVLPDVTPAPAPPPKPDPALPTVLAADAIYLIRANVNCTVVEGVEGLVKITALKGPVVFAHTKFTDSIGYETRQVAEPYVYFVEAVGKGACDIIIIPEGGKPIRRKLDVGGVGPSPGPGPDPNPTPDPFMEKPAATAGPLKVLIVYDANAVKNLTPEQYAILYSEKAGGVKDYIRGHVSVTGGYYDFRIWADGTDASADAAMWGKVMAKPRKSLPWLYAGNGKNGYNGPLPKDTAGTLAVLKKLAGE